MSEVFAAVQVIDGGLMRYEVMTGLERRRLWSDEEKLSILGEADLSGETVASVARRHDITRQHIYQWRREMRRKGLINPRDPMLVPVEIAEGMASDPVAHSGSVDQVELVLTNGRRIRGRAMMSDRQWVRLIRIAEAA